jgi:hypothetical protein
MSLRDPLTPMGIDPWTVQLVAQRLKLYATPGTNLQVAEKIILSYLYTVFFIVQYIFMESDASSIINRFEFSFTYQYIGKQIQCFHIRVCNDIRVR